MFTEYQSRPITRLAHKVSATDVITAQEAESTSTLSDGDKLVEFKHYEPVAIGDYIVYLNDSDVYHCNAKVFAERNLV